MKQFLRKLFLATIIAYCTTACIENEIVDPDPVAEVIHNPREISVQNIEEQFVVPTGNPANVFLCIDLSGSMMWDDQVNLWNNIDALVNRLDEYYIDYRIGVTGAGSRNLETCGVLGSIDEVNYVTPSQNDRSGLIQTLLWQSNNPMEACIDSIGYGFTDNYDLNEPFWRDGEPLHIISVSDEIDQSWDFTPELVASALEIHELIHESKVTYAAVVNPYEAAGYETLVDLMGADGEMVSIFDEDWTPAIDNLDYLAMIVDGKYYLKNIPDQDTLRVLVEDDGITFAFDPQDWIYDMKSNSIEFVSYSPKPDALVIVTYTARG